MSLRYRLKKRTGLAVLAELTGGPGFSVEPIERFLEAYRQAASGGHSVIPAGFDLAGITLPQSPCGDATVDGRCGNNLDRVCIGERIYEAAASEECGVRSRLTISPGRSEISNPGFARPCPAASHDQQAARPRPGAYVIHHQLPVRKGPHYEVPADFHW